SCTRRWRRLPTRKVILEIGRAPTRRMPGSTWSDEIRATREKRTGSPEYKKREIPCTPKRGGCAALETVADVEPVDERIHAHVADGSTTRMPARASQSPPSNAYTFGASACDARAIGAIAVA